LDGCEEDLGATGVVRDMREADLEGTVRLYPDTVDLSGSLCRNLVENHESLGKGCVSDPHLSPKEGDGLLLSVSLARKRDGEETGEKEGRQLGGENVHGQLRA
jgi:hypothetical protein